MLLLAPIDLKREIWNQGFDQNNKLLWFIGLRKNKSIYLDTTMEMC